MQSFNSVEWPKCKCEFVGGARKRWFSVCCLENGYAGNCLSLQAARPLKGVNLWCVNDREIGLTFNGYDALRRKRSRILTAVQAAICHCGSLDTSWGFTSGTAKEEQWGYRRRGGSEDVDFSIFGNNIRNKCECERVDLKGSWDEFLKNFEIKLNSEFPSCHQVFGGKNLEFAPVNVQVLNEIISELIHITDTVSFCAFCCC